MKIQNRYDVVLYHGGCSDGFCAAYIIWRYDSPKAEFIPVSYGQPPPEVLKGKRVLIVDFSYKRDVMKEIVAYTLSLDCLDHHKTAENELRGFAKWCAEVNLPIPEIKFDLTKSGARLAWEHCRPGQEAPKIVDYVEDRDLWKHALPHSREISAALRSYPMKMQHWDTLYYRLQQDPRGLIGEGEAILRYQDEVVRQHVDQAQETTVAGHQVLAVNATVLQSEIAGELARGRPFGATWRERGDGKVSWSLRSDDQGLDVSEVAKSMGGGGHPRAAGFETDV